ncbi:Fatty acyl-CoA elongase/Polyunsaturated fatty acid specific elongation enzyme [Yamadazyma tenuis]|uniref:Elongation of fatty acids protein n=1 Tax=Candida tenuis (strain ATCC 10573 / BCRC 21748 / CBS 615 / JCM 9827 / NBRC 10315 / NRRL Y-1498 / VKM Y-70) TaxID=590646 RepID=G3B9X6_CANTC|nr:uncharacterized protein CANTEDRAFT_109600 [Yamadazyma tenuis ATCC 10573]EGV61350.1 hypothetical protein CANTEDRAFT_109600 [Yamadazyma tenuis ATCC 10573]WEJ92564.1 Fatty acyl-CoA elongase/Polyunsaturated fatty acid specific elongation enzyme [Yamadazyma tenuis]
MSYSFPFPTPDTPFGVKLFPYFDWLVSKITGGELVPSKFEFIAGEVPLSTGKPVLAAIATYYLVIFGGDFIFKKFKITPFVLNGPFQVHNVILTTASSTLLVLMVEQIFPMIYYEGLYYAICSAKAWTQELEVLYYFNYIFKFVEFVDTLFLVIKQKRLTFLHTYHHGATALLCYTQLTGKTAISWVPITLNLWVHVVMYFYYFLAARGIRVWWKEWVTRFQILQFILDLGFVYFATYNKIVDEFLGGSLPYCGSCTGEMSAAYMGCGILSSYLVLFISFYIDVYKKKTTRRSKRVKSVSGGVAAQVNEYVHTSARDATPVPESKVRSRKA